MATTTGMTTPKVADTTRVMYVGPNRFDLGLINGAVYIDGIPKFIKDSVKDYPLMANLFVSISQLNEARQQLAKQGSVLYVAYQEASLRKGGN